MPFTIYDFPTSPVPTAVAVGADKPDAARGIAVNSRAKALFFLQTARIDRRRSVDEIKAGKTLEIARYVVHYADGSRESVPVRSEIDVEHFRQKEVQPLPGAQIAWTKPYEGGESAVAYLQTWNNPKPDMEIQSVDVEAGADPAGVAVLLALSAAK